MQHRAAQFCATSCGGKAHKQERESPKKGAALSRRLRFSKCAKREVPKPGVRLFFFLLRSDCCLALPAQRMPAWSGFPSLGRADRERRGEEGTGSTYTNYNGRFPLHLPPLQHGRERQEPRKKIHKYFAEHRGRNEIKRRIEAYWGRHPSRDAELGLFLQLAFDCRDLGDAASFVRSLPRHEVVFHSHALLYHFFVHIL